MSTFTTSDEYIYVEMMLALAFTQLVIKYFSNIEDTIKDTDPKIPHTHQTFIREGSLLLTLFQNALFIVIVFTGFSWFWSFLISPSESSSHIPLPSVRSAPLPRRIPLKSFAVAM